MRAPVHRVDHARYARNARPFGFVPARDRDSTIDRALGFTATDACTRLKFAIDGRPLYLSAAPQLHVLLTAPSSMLNGCCNVLDLCAQSLVLGFGVDMPRPHLTAYGRAARSGRRRPRSGAENAAASPAPSKR